MIKLFISDIDGCLSEPYEKMDMDRLMQIAGLVREGGDVGSHAHVPAFSLCSGRPFPYVECVSQMLGVQMPVLFESGGGIFYPEEAKIDWSPALSEETLSHVRDVTLWLEKEGVKGTSMVVDYAKRAHAGVIGPDPQEILEAIPKVEAFVDLAEFGFDVLPTRLSIDIVPPGVTKEAGMQWMLDKMGLDWGEVAYIGDSMGDYEALRRVGFSFAPENANEKVKAVVDQVTGRHSAGVLEALNLCIERNQQTLKTEELN